MIGASRLAAFKSKVGRVLGSAAARQGRSNAPRAGSAARNRAPDHRDISRLREMSW
jgi:hypothetical protein